MVVASEAYAPKLRVGELLQEPLVRTMPLAVTAWCFLSVTLYAQVSSPTLCLEFMRGIWGGDALRGRGGILA